MSEPKTLAGRIRALMADGELRTAAEVAEALCGKPVSVRVALWRMVGAGVAQECGHVGTGQLSRVFRLAPGLNVAPQPLDTERVRQRRAKVAQRCKEPDAWWPKADPVVTDAMRAMMRGDAACSTDR